MSNTSTGGEQARDSSYLVFRVRREECVIASRRVHEITTLPGSSGEAPELSASGMPRGFIELYGRSIPVIDLGEVLGHGQSRRKNKRYVIVLWVESVDGGRHYVGWMVDAVSKVVPVPESSIVPVGKTKWCCAPGCLGRVRINGRFKTVLDPDQLCRSGGFSLDINAAPRIADSAGL